MNLINDFYIHLIWSLHHSSHSLSYHIETYLISHTTFLPFISLFSLWAYQPTKYVLERMTEMTPEQMIHSIYGSNVCKIDWYSLRCDIWDAKKNKNCNLNSNISESSEKNKFIDERREDEEEEGEKGQADCNG